MRMLIHMLITKLSHLCHIESAPDNSNDAISFHQSLGAGLFAVEREMKLATLVQLAFNPNFLLVQVYYLLNYAQAKTSVSILALRCMRLMKALKNQCFLIIGYAASSITHIDGQAACFGCRYINRYNPMSVTEIDCVTDQVIQHSFDQPEIGMHCRVFRFRYDL